MLEANTGIGTSFNAREPRHLIADFTGEVSVSAKISVTNDDWIEIKNSVKEDLYLTIDITNLPSEILMRKYQVYKNGDFVSDNFSHDAPILLKGKGQRTWRPPTSAEYEGIIKRIFWLTLDISYFPTFVFNFPDKIYLSSRGDKIHGFYRGVFQDILNADNRGHTIEQDIIRRLRAPDLAIPWASFLSIFGARDERTKIQMVIDRASAMVTRVVFERWNEIFREQSGGKEVVITFETEEGIGLNAQKQIIPTNKHDIFIKFQVKDGTRRFDVNNRSLGFRWFFSFMLFTQFRIARSSTRPVLFLFDEPPPIFTQLLNKNS